MRLQAVDMFEASKTHFTSERLLPCQRKQGNIWMIRTTIIDRDGFTCVYPHVLNQRIFLYERRFTFVTLEHLFATVNLHVLFPIVAILKVCVAYFTLERSLSGVRSSVFFQSIALFERCRTNVAFVALFVQMTFQMIVQFELRFHPLGAQFTFEELIALMHLGNMVSQGFVIAKTSLTLRTVEGVVDVLVELSFVKFQ